MNNEFNQKQFVCALLLPKTEGRDAYALAAKHAGKRRAAHKLVEEGKRLRRASCVLLAGVIAMLVVAFQAS